MGETTLKFVHGLGVVAVTIHEPHGWDANLTGIARVLNVLGLLLGTPG